MSSKKSAKAKGGPTAQPVAWPATEISLAPVDDECARLSRAGWELIACADGIGVLTSFLDQGTVAVDLTAWPPHLLPIAAEWTRDARPTPDGGWALLVGWKEQRVLRWHKGSPEVDVLAMPKKKLGCAAIALLGNRVAAIPGPLGHDNKSSPLTCADTLLVEESGALRPFAFDDPGGTAWELNGGVHLASGIDVVAWAGRLGLWRSGALVAVGPALPRGHANFGFTAVPFESGFFCAAGNALRFVDPVAGAETKIAASLGDVVAVTGSAERLFVTTLPLAHHIVDPATRSARPIPSAGRADLGFLLFDTPVGAVTIDDQTDLVRIPV